MHDQIHQQLIRLMSFNQKLINVNRHYSRRQETWSWVDLSGSMGAIKVADIKNIGDLPIQSNLFDRTATDSHGQKTLNEKVKISIPRETSKDEFTPGAVNTITLGYYTKNEQDKKTLNHNEDYFYEIEEYYANAFQFSLLHYFLNQFLGKTVDNISISRLIGRLNQMSASEKAQVLLEKMHPLFCVGRTRVFAYFRSLHILCLFGNDSIMNQVMECFSDQTDVLGRALLDMSASGFGRNSVCGSVSPLFFAITSPHISSACLTNLLNLIPLDRAEEVLSFIPYEFSRYSLLHYLIESRLEGCLQAIIRLVNGLSENEADRLLNKLHKNDNSLFCKLKDGTPAQQDVFRVLVARASRQVLTKLSLVQPTQETAATSPESALVPAPVLVSEVATEASSSVNIDPELKPADYLRALFSTQSQSNQLKNKETLAATSAIGISSKLKLTALQFSLQNQLEAFNLISYAIISPDLNDNNIYTILLDGSLELTDLVSLLTSTACKNEAGSRFAGMQVISLLCLMRPALFVRIITSQQLKQSAGKVLDESSVLKLMFSHDDLFPHINELLDNLTDDDITKAFTPAVMATLFNSRQARYQLLIDSDVISEKNRVRIARLLNFKELLAYPSCQAGIQDFFTLPFLWKLGALDMGKKLQDMGREFADCFVRNQIKNDRFELYTRAYRELVLSRVAHLDSSEEEKRRNSEYAIELWMNAMMRGEKIANQDAKEFLQTREGSINPFSILMSETISVENLNKLLANQVVFDARLGMVHGDANFFGMLFECASNEDIRFALNQTVHDGVTRLQSIFSSDELVSRLQKLNWPALFRIFENIDFDALYESSTMTMRDRVVKFLSAYLLRSHHFTDGYILMRILSSKYLSMPVLERVNSSENFIDIREKIVRGILTMTDFKESYFKHIIHMYRDEFREVATENAAVNQGRMAIIWLAKLIVLCLGVELYGMKNMEFMEEINRSIPTDFTDVSLLITWLQNLHTQLLAQIERIQYEYAEYLVNARDFLQHIADFISGCLNKQNFYHQFRDILTADDAVAIPEHPEGGLAEEELACITLRSAAESVPMVVSMTNSESSLTGRGSPSHFGQAPRELNSELVAAMVARADEMKPL